MSASAMCTAKTPCILAAGSNSEGRDLKLEKNHHMKGVISNLKRITTWREGSQTWKESPHEGRDLKIGKNHHMKGVITKLERITTWRERYQTWEESPHEGSNHKIWKNHHIKGVILKLEESPHEGSDLKIGKNQHMKGVISNFERVSKWREWTQTWKKWLNETNLPVIFMHLSIQRPEMRTFGFYIHNPEHLISISIHGHFWNWIPWLTISYSWDIWLAPALHGIQNKD